MSALPMPIRKPDFTATVGMTCEAWIAENSELLWGWWQECEGEPTDVAGYRDFQAVQYDLEVDRDELMREVLAEASWDDDRYEALKGEQIDAELNSE
jgi:hypothetical protein